MGKAVFSPKRKNLRKTLLDYAPPNSPPQVMSGQVVFFVQDSEHKDDAIEFKNEDLL